MSDAPMTAEVNKPLSTPEMLGMRGDAFVVAKHAMRLREKAESLFIEANQALADAQSFERASRSMAVQSAEMEETA